MKFFHLILLLSIILTSSVYALGECRTFDGTDICCDESGHVFCDKDNPNVCGDPGYCQNLKNPELSCIPGEDWCCYESGHVADYSSHRCCPPNYPFYNKVGNNCYAVRIESSNNYYTRLSQCNYFWDINANKYNIETKCFDKEYRVCQKDGVRTWIDGWDSKGIILGKCGAEPECDSDSDCTTNQFCNKAGGWIDWHCETKICDEGEERCFGSNSQRCEGNSWVNKGIIINKCGVECTADQQCVPRIFHTMDISNEQVFPGTYCSGNDILRDFETHTCESYKCVEDSGSDVIDSCSFRCEDVEGDGAMCITKVCDSGELMCSDEWNVLMCSGIENKWKLEEVCNYGCLENECNSFYTTSTFYMILGIIIFVFLLLAFFINSKRKNKK